MFSDLIFRLRSLFRRHTVEQEMGDELRFHLEQQVEKYVASGLSREEAQRRARLTFGGEDKIREDCREARPQGGWARVRHRAAPLRGGSGPRRHAARESGPALAIPGDPGSYR